MPSSPPWSTKDIPNLNGKIALVTGATGGLGYETALELAGAGATVILGGRNDTKGKEALEKIKAIHPNAKISFGKIDQGSLASVSEFANTFNANGQALDILVNNAGVMAPPERQTTSDGFEIQLGTNHLSHFVLTAKLLPSLRKSTAPRVVNVASLAARRGKVNFEDLNWDKSYSPWGAYEQSKLANLLFSFELQRRSDANNWGLMVVAAHPGVSTTELVKNGPGLDSCFKRTIYSMVKPIFFQSADKGALPSLYAATAKDVFPGGYYGPNGFHEMKGDVCPSFVPPLAKDLSIASKFWEESEKLTKITWDN